MERGAFLWMFLLASSIVGWLIWDLFSPMDIDYERNSYLKHRKSGDLIKPKDFIELGKVISQSEEYVNKTNAMERLHDLVIQTNVVRAFPIDHSYSSADQLHLSGLPHANKTKCGQDLNWVLNELKQNPDFPLVKGELGRELTQLIDSMGKPEAGMYRGIVSWVGSYERCKRLIFSANQLKMRYCWSRFRPKWWPKNETLEQQAVIRVGSCLPESCDTQADQIYGQEISSLVKFDWSPFYSRALDFESMFCLPNEQSPIRQIPPAGYVYMLILFKWILVVLVATIAFEINKYKVNKKWKRYQMLAMPPNGSTGEKQQGIVMENVPSGTMQLAHVDFGWTAEIMEALSLSRTLKNFTRDSFYVNYKHDNNRPRVDMSWLNSMKFLMCLCMVLSHTSFIGWAYTRSLTEHIELATGIGARVLLCVGRLVDTFFVLFGVFGSYYLISKFKMDNLSNPLVWIHFNLKALLRIIPLYATVYGFARYIGPYIGAGPWWDYGVDKYSIRSLCQHSDWWTIIPYFSSHESMPASFCVPPAWFLVVYLRLALLIPIIVYILYKLPNEWCRSIFVLILSLITNMQFSSRLYRQESLKDEAFTLYGGFLVILLDKFQVTGAMFSYTHIGLLAISCYSGYLLRMYKIGKITEWPSWISSHSSLAFIVSSHFIIQLGPAVGFGLTDYFETTPTIAQVVVANYIMAVVWPIINCILIIQTSTMYNQYAFIRFFSHPFWTSFNRLGLCVYLIHWEVITYSVTGHELGPTYGFKTDILRHCAFSYLFTLIISVIAYFFIEAPVTNVFILISNKIEKLLKSGAQKKNLQPAMRC